MRRPSPGTLRLVLVGGMLLLSLIGAGAGLVSFLLLRAGYGFAVWGVLPFLALLLAVVVFAAALWWAAGGALPGGERKQEARDVSSRGGPRRGNDV